MSTPLDVVNAMKNSTFCANQVQFWQMAQFLFSDYKGNKIWTELPRDTFRAMAIQLHTVIESVDAITELESRTELIYHTYIVILTKIRGPETLQQTMYKEDPQVLKALHNIYRLLFRIKTKLPLFGHVK